MTPESLRLQAHPEGGWYRETWRATDTVTTPFGERSAGDVDDFELETP